MKLSELGELGLIARLQAAIPSHAKNAIGIGDDCAVIPKDNTASWLITTDMLVDKIHFLSEHISPFALGHKSLAVNLSDIAAMGGTPRFVFLSLALPPHAKVKWLDELFRGFGELARVHNIVLLGGDTTRAEATTISVTVIGECDNSNIKLRSATKPGDIICTTGFLGDSGAGLDAILNKRSINNNTRHLIDRHYLPRPHLREGSFLASQNGVHAMMDVSDGIASDLRHIMQQSHCGAEIALDRLPRSTEMRDYCKQYDLSCESIAASAGEDYCLLVTIDHNHFVQINSDFAALFGRPLNKIGTITGFQRELSFRSRGNPVSLFVSGFDHFKKARTE